MKVTRARERGGEARARTLWSEEEDAMLAALTAEGLSRRQVAARLGRSLHAVDKRAEMRGVRRAPKWNAALDARLAELAAAGKSGPEIGRFLSAEAGRTISRCAVIGRAMRKGIKLLGSTRDGGLREKIAATRRRGDNHGGGAHLKARIEARKEGRANEKPGAAPLATLLGGPPLAPARTKASGFFGAGQEPQGCRWIHGLPGGVGVEFEYREEKGSKIAEAGGQPARQGQAAARSRRREAPNSGEGLDPKSAEAGGQPASASARPEAKRAPASDQAGGLDGRWRYCQRPLAPGSLYCAEHAARIHGGRAGGARLAAIADANPGLDDKALAALARTKLGFVVSARTMRELRNGFDKASVAARKARTAAEALTEKPKPAASRQGKRDGAPVLRDGPPGLLRMKAAAHASARAARPSGRPKAPPRSGEQRRRS